MREWINPGRYVTGRELAATGMAELVEFEDLGRLPIARLVSEPRLANTPQGVRPSRAPGRVRTAPAAKSQKPKK